MTSRLSGKVMIVVDDEPLIRSVFGRVLRLAGAEVHEADGVAAACDLLTRGVRCDALITDHHMPGLGGVDLQEWVRPRWPALPIVLVSGNPEAHHGDLFDLVLTKPINGAQLVAAVAELLDVHRATTRIGRISRPPEDA